MLLHVHNAVVMKELYQSLSEDLALTGSSSYAKQDPMIYRKLGTGIQDTDFEYDNIG